MDVEHGDDVASRKPTSPQLPLDLSVTSRFFSYTRNNGGWRCTLETPRNSDSDFTVRPSITKATERDGGGGGRAGDDSWQKKIPVPIR